MATPTSVGACAAIAVLVEVLVSTTGALVAAVAVFVVVSVGAGDGTGVSAALAAGVGGAVCAEPTMGGGSTPGSSTLTASSVRRSAEARGDIRSALPAVPSLPRGDNHKAWRQYGPPIQERNALEVTNWLSIG